ncbi:MULTISPECIES: head maturation protease, ClpP-related [unclassified Marinobacter]|jgi:ATP-dependent protease ClpP protease subunit|uniref:head maturation protease, ClpP-related n=1 Tax=unclassified Marinobacter TaxID=83889 RepID=UPI0020106E26|nr:MULTISPECIES: head maturation protease, ClpP-related [unclassified Marinobacter]MCL1488429.1 ATP-dependent Clp protease proteolytic subunit [Marinobacter sp.]UQG65927.1 ATP-dependent Clp protease proteolytic subunit [Marinobacter sp. M2C]UQG70207.1 ATP-dependent Clp protease proteolytic subunit [Marinobacter sp. M1C]
MTQIKALHETNEIYIYQAIGELDISAQGFVDKLKTLDLTQTVHVRINSGGGDMAHALAIYNALLQCSDVVCYVDGIAASAASVIAMAGGKVVMAENALMMIHRPWSAAVGTSDDMRKAGEVLDKFQPTLTQAYIKKTGLADNRINDMLTAETWMNAQEAVALGFADEIAGSMAIAASADLSVFNNVPEHLLKKHQEQAGELADIKALLARGNQNRIENGISLDEVLTAGCNTRAKAGEYILAKMAEGSEPIYTHSTRISTMDNRTESFMNDATDALLLRNNMPVKNASDAARAMSRSNPVGIARQHLTLNGISTDMMSPRQVIDKAFAMSSVVHHTTSDFGSLLGNVAGKSLREAYQDEFGSHEIWTGETEVQDFKPQSLVQLSEAPDLLKVNEGGEYTEGSFSDSGMTFRIEKYGRLFTLTREAIINDDLSAFTRLPAAFGKSAKRKEADLVYQVLTGNPNLADNVALFHATHGNIVSGLTALNVEAIAQGRTLMRMQKGINSAAPINVVPQFLIVPAALETQAEQLLATLVDPSKANDTVNPSFIRGLTLVVDSRLDEVGSDCYLAASPSQIDTITRAYLAGEERPYFEQREGWEVDGLHVKSRMEFAAVPVDYRGLVKLQIAQ